ncbi:hypothetical protein [Mucilaginibacter sp. UR6-11]|uniref:hypothetical protein n=1 Tax=Mucilaginibacter sp. UR6-11 TaxID=1435644 RepID=UPI001E422000|nr:hypothetical protein [Mucilaginibacter sp. UR6-11]MCC8426391.1 hypothetical protein [Mucilaginibacter sp. UR6-11]
MSSETVNIINNETYMNLCADCLLVKRFESSFSSFSKSIDRCLAVHEMVKTFIDKTGKFILDRNFIDRIRDFELDEIEAKLEEYATGDLKGKTPKNTEVYDIDKFQRREDFLNDIESDILVFHATARRLKELKLVDNDTKQTEIIKQVKSQLENEPDRKIILFQNMLTPSSIWRCSYVRNLAIPYLSAMAGYPKNILFGIHS